MKTEVDDGSDYEEEIYWVLEHSQKTEGGEYLLFELHFYQVHNLINLTKSGKLSSAAA